MYHYTLQLPLVAIQQALIVFNNTGVLSFLIYLQTERYSEMQTTILVKQKYAKKVSHKNDDTLQSIEAARSSHAVQVAQACGCKSTFTLLSLIHCVSTETNNVT